MALNSASISPQFESYKQNIHFKFEDFTADDGWLAVKLS